jgi:hypothetical protein
VIIGVPIRFRTYGTLPSDYPDFVSRAFRRLSPRRRDGRDRTGSAYHGTTTEPPLMLMTSPVM